MVICHEDGSISACDLLPVRVFDSVEDAERMLQAASVIGGMCVDIDTMNDLLSAGITYHPATGYSTVQRSTTLADLARWLGTDEATALDWLVYKVAAFRGVDENEARNIVTGGQS